MSEHKKKQAELAGAAPVPGWRIINKLDSIRPYIKQAQAHPVIDLLTVKVKILDVGIKELTACRSLVDALESIKQQPDKIIECTKQMYAAGDEREVLQREAAALGTPEIDDGSITPTESEAMCQALTSISEAEDMFEQEYERANNKMTSAMRRMPIEASKGCLAVMNGARTAAATAPPTSASTVGAPPEPRITVPPSFIAETEAKADALTWEICSARFPLTQLPQSEAADKLRDFSYALSAGANGLLFAVGILKLFEAGKKPATADIQPLMMKKQSADATYSEMMESACSNGGLHDATIKDQAKGNGAQLLKVKNALISCKDKYDSMHGPVQVALGNALATCIQGLG